VNDAAEIALNGLKNLPRQWCYHLTEGFSRKDIYER
jgi:hypothetical protein